MSNKSSSDDRSSRPMIYVIRIKGHLGRQWMEWFGGFTITPDEDGTTFLIGRVVDQAALHGVLRKIHDLGIELLLVSSV